jgi:hypothetical protein
LNKFEAVAPVPSLADTLGFLVFVIDFLSVVGFSSTFYKLDYDKVTGAASLVSFSPLANPFGLKVFVIDFLSVIGFSSSIY